MIINDRTAVTAPRRPPLPYHFYVQERLDTFWRRYGTRGRRVLFIFGLGFDPLCVPALGVVADLFRRNSSLHTVCARFTNIHDEHLEENTAYTEECLERIRYTTAGLRGPEFRHFEIEVNMFSESRELVGDSLLIDEFSASCGAGLADYTDIIVDISAFPRALMYALLGWLWKRRGLGQNLFAALTSVPVQPEIEEWGYTIPRYMLGGPEPPKDSNIVWIPVLGGRIERFEYIHDFLRPSDVFPIIPFPAKDPRLGDDIILKAREPLFEKWRVPFTNVMYASGEIPFDVFRKIHDIVRDYTDFRDTLCMVISALSGRSLSLGALLAALWNDIPICHSQPTTYRITPEARDECKLTADTATPMLYWLDGELYDLEPRRKDI